MEHTNLITCIYARRSNEDAKDGESIENQISLLKQYCANEGYLNINVFTDDGYTGTNFNRPGFQKMFSLIKHRHVKRVIVKDLSRFGRNNLEVSRYLGVEFPRYNVEFISIIDGPDSSDPDNLITQVKNMVNEFYAKDISEKQKHSLRARSNNGQHISTSPVFGYKIDPDDKHHWIIDEPAASTVRMIFELYLKGIAIAEIARKLEENKFLSPSAYTGFIIKGSRTESNPYYWCDSSITAILKRQEYCGDTVNFKTYHKSFKDKAVQYKEEADYVIFKDTQDPIVSREDYEKARERRMSTQRVKQEKVEHLLDTLVFCGDCGSKMYLNKKTNKSVGTFYVYYCNTYRKKEGCCAHYIQENTLVDEVLNVLFSLFVMYNSDKKEFRKRLLRGINSTNLAVTNNTKRRNEEIHKRIQELQEQQGSLHESFIKKEIELNLLNNVTAYISKSISDLEEELGENLIVLDEVADKKLSIKPFLQKLEIYSDHNRDEIDKFIVSQFVERIELYEKKETGTNGKEISTVKPKIYFSGIGYINIEEIKTYE